MKMSLLILLLTLTACNSYKSKLINMIDDRGASITCYSGGKIIYDGESIGKPFSEDKSDGYYFTDKATNQLMEISGQCIIIYK